MTGQPVPAAPAPDALAFAGVLTAIHSAIPAEGVATDEEAAIRARFVRSVLGSLLRHELDLCSLRGAAVLLREEPAVTP